MPVQLIRLDRKAQGWAMGGECDDTEHEKNPKDSSLRHFPHPVTSLLEHYSCMIGSANSRYNSPITVTNSIAGISPKNSIIVVIGFIMGKKETMKSYVPLEISVTLLKKINTPCASPAPKGAGAHAMLLYYPKIPLKELQL